MSTGCVVGMHFRGDEIEGINFALSSEALKNII